MRLLIVSNLYAPALSPRAFRWHAIARHWTGQGHEVAVICAAHRGSPAAETLDGVTVTRIGGALDAWRGRLAPPVAAPAAAAPASGPGGLRSAAKWLHDRTWKRVYWPDYAAPWYAPAKRAARERLRAARHDALITVALPFTAHLVGLACRPLAPVWLADSGDPFSLNHASPPNNLALYDRLNRRAEAKVLAAADVFSVTTAATADRALAAFPSARGKVVVIPPIAAPPELPRHAANFFPDDGRRRLVYLGNLYPRVREPGPLLALLRRLRQEDAALAAKVDVHMFGAPGAFAADFAAMAADWPGFQAHPPVDRATVARVLEGADGLINIGNATEEQLPSKLVEYAATGKPILNLVSRVDDASAGFLAGYPLATNVAVGDGAMPDRAFRDFLREMLGRRVDRASVARFLAPYGVERIAGAYLEALGAVRPGLAA